MAKIISLKDKSFEKRLEDWELEGAIHSKFLERQDLMRKLPIMHERITKIDTWLLQHKLPLDILITICARANYCNWVSYGDVSPEQKHFMLLHLRACYAEFQKLPERWQEALWPMMWGKWHAEFLDEEMKEAASGTA